MRWRIPPLVIGKYGMFVRRKRCAVPLAGGRSQRRYAVNALATGGSTPDGGDLADWEFTFTDAFGAGERGIGNLGLLHISAGGGAVRSRSHRRDAGCGGDVGEGAVRAAGGEALSGSYYQSGT